MTETPYEEAPDFDGPQAENGAQDDEEGEPVES